MKRFVLLALVIVMFVSFPACSNVGENDRLDDAQAIAGVEYVGEWKASTLAGMVNGVKTYTVSVIELKQDGSGTYKGRALKWTFSQENNTINFTVTQENVSAALQIQEFDGKTVLKFYDDVYYRADEFETV